MMEEDHHDDTHEEDGLDREPRSYLDDTQAVLAFQTCSVDDRNGRSVHRRIDEARAVAFDGNAVEADSGHLVVRRSTVDGVVHDDKQDHSNEEDVPLVHHASQHEKVAEEDNVHPDVVVVEDHQGRKTDGTDRVKSMMRIHRCC
jgi:hypothetical protein